MSRGKILTALLALALIAVLIAVFDSCHEGTRPPAERDRLEGTSYRADAAVVASPQHVAVRLGDEFVLLDSEQI